MSATPNDGAEPRSTSVSQEARYSGIDSTPERANIATTLQVGHLATVDDELFEVFGLRRPEANGAEQKPERTWLNKDASEYIR